MEESSSETMETWDLPNWSDFPNAIARIRAEFGSHTVDPGDEYEHVVSNRILFRSQSDNEWALKTTLERTTVERISISHYLERADFVVNEIESSTGKNWQLPSWPEIRKEIADSQDSMRAHLPCYDYLVYLRHHGFPSPLLDWSSSPYVAAYFAMQQSYDAEHSSVFAYIESPEGGKSLCGSEPMITLRGPHVTTHTRHFAQKASYTTATRWDKEKKQHYFCSHHSVKTHPVDLQDVFIKITIPRSDRILALRELEDYNINHYTLFQTEDALVRALGLRAFDLEVK